MRWSPMLAVVVALSLAVWSLCYFAGSPLDAAETVVVVGLSGLVAWVGATALGRLREAETPLAKKVKPPTPSSKRRKNK